MTARVLSTAEIVLSSASSCNSQRDIEKGQYEWCEKSVRQICFSPGRAWCGSSVCTISQSGYDDSRHLCLGIVRGGYEQTGVHLSNLPSGTRYASQPAG